MASKDQIQQEALKALAGKRMAGVEISMGVGKTRIGLQHMASNYTTYSKFLVVAPKKSIFQSWTDEIQKAGFDYLLDHIDFTTYISLTKRAHDYDIVFLDECHSLKGRHNKWMLAYMKAGGNTIGLTGTYPKYKNSEAGKMCNFYCPKVYQYLTDDAIKDNLLNDYEIYVHPLTLSTKNDIEKTGKHGVFHTSEVKEYNYWSDRLERTVNGGSSTMKEIQTCRIQRMKALQKFKTKEAYAKLLLDNCSEDRKTIIFANEKEQADMLCKHSVHSGNKDSKKNLNDFKKGIITKCSAVQQLSEGVTIPELKQAIIMHSFSNNRQAAQKIGRVLRLNPDDKATVHILCYVDTIDLEWVKNALSGFDVSKVHFLEKKMYHE